MSIEEQDYIEDSSVCCSPIEFKVYVEVLSDSASITTRTDTEWGYFMRPD